MHFGGGKSYIHVSNIHVIAVIFLLMPRLQDLIPILKSRRLCVHVLHKHIQAIVSLCDPMQN